MDEENKVLYNIGLAIIILLSLIGIICRVFNINILSKTIPCILHSATGLYCPGCGGTRSVVALLSGDFVQSFILHPVVPYCFIIFIWYMLSNSIQIISKQKIKIGMKYRNIYVIIAFAIVILNCIVKNAMLLFYGINII